MLSRNQLRLHRKRRIRAKVKGTSERPRLCVFRSLSAIYAQIVDDNDSKTLVSSSSQALKVKSFDMEAAKKVGLEIAKKAQAKNISNVVFDRGAYKYHGKVKSLAEGAREGGLKF